MTDQEWLDLGRRAVAYRGWRWMPGMLSGENDRVVYTDPDCAGALVSSGCPSGPDWESNLDPPDLRDPATIGCLLALIESARPGSTVWVSRDCEPDPLDDDEYVVTPREEWTVWIDYGDGCFILCLGCGPTRAHALVAALESAPEHTP